MGDRTFESMLNSSGAVTDPKLGNPNSFGERVSGETSKGSIDLTIQPVRESYTIVKGGIEYIVTLKAYAVYTDIIHEGEYITVGSIKYLIIGVEDMGGRGKYLKILLSKL